MVASGYKQTCMLRSIHSLRSAIQMFSSSFQWVPFASMFNAYNKRINNFQNKCFDKVSKKMTVHKNMNPQFHLLLLLVGS